MPDQIEPGGPQPYSPGMEARVAVLEEIAVSTKTAINGLRSEIRQFRTEMHQELRSIRSDCRWLLGIMLGGFAGLLGVMAHGFHWL